MRLSQTTAGFLENKSTLGYSGTTCLAPLPRLDGEMVSSTMWDCQLEVSYTPLVTKSGRSTDCEPQGVWVGPCLQRGEGWGWALAGGVLREHKSAADNSQQLVK